MIIRPYGSEKFDKPGFETFYETVNFYEAVIFEAVLPALLWGKTRIDIIRGLRYSHFAIMPCAAPGDRPVRPGQAGQDLPPTITGP